MNSTKPKFSFGLNLFARRFALYRNWGIICDAISCECNDPGLEADLKRAVELFDTKIPTLARGGRVAEALSGIKELMTLYNGRLHTSYSKKAMALWEGFQIGILKKSTYAQGMECMSQLLEIVEGFMHPKSDILRGYREYQKNPGSSPNFWGQE